MMNCSSSLKHEKGVTLTEILVVLAITTFLVVVALPSYVSLIANNKETSLSASLLSALNLAKSEALKRNTAVNVCAANATNPTTSAICGTSFDNGWIVVIPGTTPSLIRYYDTVSTTNGTVFLSGASSNIVTFNPPFGTTGADYTFTITPPNASCPTTIVISTSGRFTLTSNC